jgi:hypothetical protein
MFQEVCKLKTELTENGNFCLFTTKGKQKRANFRLFAENAKIGSGKRKSVFHG